MTNFPLVSCVMPTTLDRRRFAEHAIAQFHAQDYPNKELIILGNSSLRPAFIPALQTRYWGLIADCTLGTKRNLLNGKAHGEYIIHWDDDDWYSENRISIQMRVLQDADADICGLRSMLFYDLVTNNRWLYKYEGLRKWLAGGSLLYKKSLWKANPFPDIQVGSDAGFLGPVVLSNSAVVEGINCYVATIHPGNTSPRKTTAPYFSPYSGPVPQGVVEMAALLPNMEYIETAKRA